jgi:hypothetical protein
MDTLRTRKRSSLGELMAPAPTRPSRIGYGTEGGF